MEANFDEMMNQGPSNAPEGPTSSPTPQITPQAAPAENSHFDEMMNAGPGQAEQEIPKAQPRSWSQTIGDVADTANMLTLPGQLKGAASYWSGQNTPLAATYSGEQKMQFGNLPETLYELGRGGLNSILGHGPNSEELAKKDDAYQTQLAAQYPSFTLGGQILGLMGLAAGGELGMTRAVGALPSAMANAPKATFASKVAMAGLINAGIGALSGFSDSRNWDERVKGAETGAMIGGGLGLAGGAVGAALDKGVTKAATAEAEKAATQQGFDRLGLGETGLNMHEPFKEQLGAYGQALNKVAPDSDMTLKDISGSLKKSGIAALKQAGTRESALSSEGIGSIAANMMEILKEDNADVARHMDSLSPVAKQAWAVVQKLGQQAISMAGTGGTTMPLKDVVTDMIRVNKMYSPNDGDYQAIRGSLNKWFDGVVHSSLFSGDPQALDDIAAFKQLYGAGAKLNTKHALGRMIDFQHSPNEVSNWVMGASKAGQMSEALDLLDSIKSIKGTGSPEWGALRSIMFKNGAAPGAQTPEKLAATLGTLSQTPIAKALYTEQQLANMGILANVVKQIPKEAAHDPNWLQVGLGMLGLGHGGGHHGTTGVGAGAILGAGHAVYEGVTGGHDPFDIMWDAIKEGAKMGALGLVGGQAMRAPATIRFGAPQAATNIIKPPPEQRHKAEGGSVASSRKGGYDGRDKPDQKQKLKSTENGTHWSSSSLINALSIARRAKSG